MLKSLVRQGKRAKYLDTVTQLNGLRNNSTTPAGTGTTSSTTTSVAASNKKSRYEKKSKQQTNAKKNSTQSKMSRNWIALEENNRQLGGKAGVAMDPGQYKLLSYNILAQDLLVEHLHLYTNTETELLKWEHRLRRLKEEIHFIRPDILCLQEMQYSHLKGLLKQIRGKRKLEYVFKKKTGHRTDGCAIIYDKDKFQLLEEKGIEYHKPNELLLNRENIALMAKFCTKCEDPSNKQQLVVATTHLLYNPRREDVRMAQVQVLLQELSQFSLCPGGDSALPILLSGDFNFESNSPGFQLLNSPTSCNSPTKADENPNPKQKLHLNALKFGSNTASTFQGNWITVDYILHSTDKLRRNIKVWSIYCLPSIEQCRQQGPMPNRFLGSDHYSLAVLFSLEKGTKQKS